MSNMQIDSVLAQIRSLSSQINAHKPANAASGIASAIGAATGQGSKTGGVQDDFASVLKKGIDQVNQAQIKASDMATAFERGTPGLELSDVMLEMQKASVSFRALTEVRNRMVSAYQDVMNMQI